MISGNWETSNSIRSIIQAVFFFFFFWWDWVWTQGFIPARLLEPCLQSILVWLFWR
jgi:hypothetical protein